MVLQARSTIKESVVECNRSVNSALTEFYKCPSELVPVGVSGHLSEKPQHFYFGDIFCYGSIANGASDRGDFPNLQELAVTDDPPLRLPFDVCEVIENLRRERYLADGYLDCGGVSTQRWIRGMYYSLRPYLRIGVRKYLQRFALRNWDRRPFPRWPVDTTAEQLMERVLVLSMKALGVQELPFIWFWPDAASSCAIVTHDVETRGGLDFTASLMDIDQGARIPASYQIIPQGSYKVSSAFVEMLKRRGFEINVHDLSHDGELFRSRESVLRGAALINRYLRDFGAEGFRSARMHRNTDYFNAFEMSYDMSIPNVAHLDPQRGGCCTVFPFFVGDKLELPLTTIQDYALFHLLGDYSTDLWEAQIREIHARHGLTSILVHPDYLCGNRNALNAYKNLLGHIDDLRRSEGMWVALPREVNHWWRQRGQMELVFERGKWRILGPGSSKASVAFAAIDGDRIVYRMNRPAACTSNIFKDGPVETPTQR